MQKSSMHSSSKNAEARTAAKHILAWITSKSLKISARMASSFFFRLLVTQTIKNFRASVAGAY